MSASGSFLSPAASGSTPFLSHSNPPNSPHRSREPYANTLPTPPSSSANLFQLDPTPSGSSGSSYTSSLVHHQNNNNNSDAGSYFDHLPPPVPAIAPDMMTRAASSCSNPSVLQPLPAPDGGALGATLQQVPPIISYDPNGSLSDFEEDDDEGENAMPGRPRKRKSTRDLRGAAATQAGAGAGAGAGGSKSGNGGPSGDDDKDDDKARRKVAIEFIEEKSKRHITFSKRKAGIMKKAYELSTLTGTQVLLLVVSESGWVYTFTTEKFKPLVKEDANGDLSQGQKLIAACLEGKGAMPDLVPDSYQPAASSTASNFEANSAQHGGQISLKTNQRANRPTATNRRVSSKGRNNIPTAINTRLSPNMDNGLPCPPGSGGIPPVPQLPTPHSAGGYLDLATPLSPRDPRSLSHPVSPARSKYGAMQQQQARAQAQHQAYPQGQEYAEMMHRAELMQLHQGGYGDDQGYDLNYGLPATSVAPSHTSMHSMHDHHSYANATLPQLPAHLTQPTSHQQSRPLSGPQRTLHHARSHPHLRQHSFSNDSASAYDLYGPHPGAPASQGGGSVTAGVGGSGGNYTHIRDASTGSQYAQQAMDPRQNGGNGYQTPMHSGGSQPGSLHNTPVNQQHIPLYSNNDDQYSGR
ncbi:uncharacterized protein JCM15063_000331 [Sporobolomyces koalae]|uniref:uncharacterized protein n=1 Tax=Sporobolomyces koalae TaxID=500713 RepID=UPI003175C312